MKSSITFCLLLFCPFYVNSQILPGENYTLNHKVIGFSAPTFKIKGNYSCEIARGYFTNIDSFKANLVLSVPVKTNKIICEVPYFGEQYTWRYTNSVKSQGLNSVLHHFKTGNVPSVDSNVKRLKILKAATGKYRDEYIFTDNNRVLYDMSGNPVWYLPDIGVLKEEYIARDIKVTPQKTITLLGGEDGYEISLDGKISWKTPNTEKHYHHELTRLSNGHYMALAAEMTKEYLMIPASTGESGLVVISNEDSSGIKINPGWKFNKDQQYPEIIEYDQNGKMVWVYRSSRYFNGSDLYFHREKDGSLNSKVHDNAFYFDEQRKELYVSCKNISRIIKIKYPEGNTLATYGELYTPGVMQNKGKGLFCGQHNCSVSKEGYLCLYNNNDCNAPSLPTVILLQQPASDKDSVKKVWEYQCTIDSSVLNERKEMNFISGGSVYELPDQCLFVDMGGQYSKLFIVNRNKEILWSALPEKWQPDMNKWLPFSQYRASIIDRETLEQLIWNSEQAKK